MTEKEYFLGIDVGTTTTKFVLLKGSGEIQKIHEEEYDIISPKENWNEQNPDDWWQAVKKGLNLMLKDVNFVVSGISFSGQMHGLVLLDENDKILRNAILWNDQRTQKQCDYSNSEKTFGKSKLLKNVGNIALTGFTAPKLLWVKENEPDIYKKISKILLPKDFIVYKLSGVHATDFSDASGTLFLDVEKKKYSQEILDFIQLDEKKLPKLFESWEVIGTLNSKELNHLNSLKGTKIIIGGGDQAVGAIGTGTVQDKMCSISLGTSGVVFLSSNTYQSEFSKLNQNQKNENENEKKAALHSFCHANGKYHLMGVTLNAANSLKWWLEKIHSEKPQTGDIDLERDFSKVYFLPYLTGERTPHNNPNARGAFIGLHDSTTKQSMTLSVLEGVAFSLKETLISIQNLFPSEKAVKNAKIIGGGAKSEKWCQIFANVFNIKIQRIVISEGPAFGAAILAISGIISESETSNSGSEILQKVCEKMVTVKDEFLPEEKWVKVYEKKFKIYCDLYQTLKNTFEDL